MKLIFNEERQKKPIKCWCENPEKDAIEQAVNLSNLPFIYKHVALMPDTHKGYGMPIGGVIACKNVVVPNAVGVDIGCGMRAMKTNLTEISQENIKKIMSEIRQRIPLGFNHHKEPQSWHGFDSYLEIPIIEQEINRAKYQLGTLGGGNHFIEIQKGSDGYIWVMIHSGSRNLGYQIAKEYNRIAKRLCDEWYSNIPVIKGEDSLAFLPVYSKEGMEYLHAMNFALEFALANRAKMMLQIILSFDAVLGNNYLKVSEEDILDIHHNYAAIESHFGQNLWIHRKGATSAKKGEKGIIPGSQGTKSYIVEGKGNPESFMSCSHGAGRKMGRKQAQKTLNLAEEQEKLKGIIHSVRSEKELDEASGAYKDINIVMAEQSDLIEILTELKPLAVIKG